ncbi:MAG: hypothetical protein HDR18_14260 [Lachnospiraceae bacterium]|nr:hypothetical protein [Lachnospiraceae bacterium]
MGKLENIKKTSKLIGKVGKIFQIFAGILTGFSLFFIIILSILRTTLNTMIAESQASFDFSNLGQFAEKLSSEGKVAEAGIVSLIFGSLFTLIITIIMHFIAKIFKRIYNGYSPFLPEIVNDLKIVSALSTLLILRNSIGLGIVSGFIFWGIIQLYEYGCELQNEVDEIL